MSDSITWAFIELMQHTDAYDRVCAEADSLPEAIAPLALTSQVPFMTMVVQEALRLYPPGWGFLRTAIQEDVILGYRIPAGARVLLSPYLMHRNSSLWNDPDRLIQSGSRQHNRQDVIVLRSSRSAQGHDSALAPACNARGPVDARAGVQRGTTRARRPAADSATAPRELEAGEPCDGARTSETMKLPPEPAISLPHRIWLGLRDPIGYLTHAEAELGDVVALRQGRSYAVFAPEHIKYVLQDNAANYEKGVKYRSALGPIMGNGIFTSEGAFWLRQRRLAQGAFHKAHMATLADTVVECATDLVQQWETCARRARRSTSGAIWCERRCA